MSKKIKLIIGSSRQGRVGAPVSEWLVKTAKEAGVELEVIDLKAENLPIFDGPSPMYVPAQTPEGQAWSAKIKEAEAFVFVTAEYNRSIPAVLKNAIDHLFHEWGGKPAAIVSYGYIDAGGSATKHLTDILSWVKLDVVEPKVGITLTQETFAEDGSFKDIDASLADAKAPFLAALEAINKA
jgi:NAD(P)H-dependent FMN reductase